MRDLDFYKWAKELCKEPQQFIAVMRRSGIADIGACEVGIGGARIVFELIPRGPSANIRLVLDVKEDGKTYGGSWETSGWLLPTGGFGGLVVESSTYVHGGLHQRIAGGGAYITYDLFEIRRKPQPPRKPANGSDAPSEPRQPESEKNL